MLLREARALFFLSAILVACLAWYYAPAGLFQHVLLPAFTHSVGLESPISPTHRELRLEPNGSYPMLSRVRALSRLVSVPDIHGDYEGLVKVLREAGLISKISTDWIGGSAVLVQTGDILDRGDDSADALRLLEKLQRQARQRGGAVIILMGNHELLNLMGFFMYATPGEDKGFLPASRQKAFDKQRGEFGSFVRSFPAALLVDMGTDASSTVLFVHGGLTGAFLRSAADPIQTLNADFRRYTNLEMFDMKRYYLEDLLSEHGPLWNRFLAMARNEGQVCSELQSVLQLVGASKMVVGHTVQTRSRVGERCGGRLVLADVGFAPYYFGHRLALEHFSNGSHIAIESTA